MSLRIAHIGAGRFSTARIFSQLGMHDTVRAAVCDLDGEKAQQARERFGFGAAYTDFREMLERETPDAVFCIGGPDVHHAVGLEVLDRGFPLYVQKPPARTADDVRALDAMARKRGVVCHVGFNLRFTPAVLRTREIVGGEGFGKPLCGMFRYGLSVGRDPYFSIFDMHIHVIDLAMYLLGDITELKIVPATVPGCRDYVAAAHFASGAAGSLNFASGQVADKEFIFYEISGEESFLYSHQGTELVWRKRGQGAWWQTPPADEVLTRGWYGVNVTEQAMGYVGDVANFLGVVRGDCEDLAPVASTVRTLEVVEEILKLLEVKR